MNAHTTLETVSPAVTVAMILDRANSRLPAILKRAAESSKAAHSAPEADPDHAAQFREDILRRYKAPYPFPWRHGGLND
jgi:hypothetical protein